MRRAPREVVSSAVAISAWTVLGPPALAGTAPTLSAAAVVAPRISLGPDAVVGEGDGHVDVRVTLSAPSNTTVSVLYNFTNITAVNGFDYTCPTNCFGGTLTFTPGQTSQTIRLGITNDTVTEPLESFAVNLSSPTGGTITRAIDPIFIKDDALREPRLSVTYRPRPADRAPRNPGGTRCSRGLYGALHPNSPGWIAVFQ